MKIANSFRVEVPLERTWQLLNDPAAVAPCLPGAAVTGRDGDDHLGTVTVKVGPMATSFTGRMRFVEQDDTAHRVVMSASGRDTRGAGNAQATVVAHAVDDGTGTLVFVETELAVFGKLTQFGSSVIQQVSTRLLAEFADRLEAMLRAESPTHTEHEPESRPLNLMQYLGGPVVRRLLPISVAVGAGAVVALGTAAYVVLR